MYMDVPILRYVYLSTVMYLPSVVVAMFNTITILVLLPVPAHIDVYSVAVYSPVAQLFSRANQ